MPLLTDEHTALRIVANELQRRGEANIDGMNRWVRGVLGAHAEQAARLVADATLLLRGGQEEQLALRYSAGAGEDVTVTRTVEGRELSITLKAGRLPITSYQELVDFYEIDTTRWRPTSQVFNFWGNDKTPYFQVKAAFEEVEYRGLTDEDRQATRDWYAALAPSWELEPYQAVANGQLLEIVVSDLHADKITTGGSGLEQHLERARHAIGRILSRATVDGVERVALVFLGDTFNDEGTGQTTNGTPQSSHGPPRDTYRRIRDFIAEMTLACSRVAPVDLYLMSGNHDRERSFYAADSLHGLLSRNPRITVNTDVRRAAIDWGVNLLGLWHGDRQKPADIAMALLREFDTRGKKVLEVHLGHEHTRREDEIHGVLLRRFRTPTPEDDWHEERMFSHNVKSITGILWHRDHGEIASYPVTFIGDT